MCARIAAAMSGGVDSSAAAGLSAKCSCCATYCRREVIDSMSRRLKLWRWQRERIVAGTL